jgi:acyl carrier protein
VTDEELLALFTRILRDLLMNDSVVLSMETRRSEIDGWDSFMYVNFIVAVELQLGVKFNVAEVESFETVGDIVVAARALKG